MKKLSGSCRSILSHFIVLLITSIFWLVILNTATDNMSDKIYFPNPKAADRATYLTCGNTTTEAKSKGCQYDILSNHWVPGVCMDQAAIVEYQVDGSWYGYTDEGRTQRLSIDTMSQKNFYYTSERDHILHCAMLRRKQWRAFVGGRTKLDSLIIYEEHTMHCAQFLVAKTENGIDYWHMPIKTWVGFAGCYVKDDGMGDMLN